MHPELAQLKTRLDAIEAASVSQATAAALSELRASLKSVEDKITLSDRFVKIEEEHESWKTLAKYITITVGILGFCGAILGVVLVYFGYTSLDKYLAAQVDKRVAYAEDLGYGLALTAKQPTFAIPHLLRCFNEKPFDEPLLIALLNDIKFCPQVWRTAKKPISAPRCLGSAAMVRKVSAESLCRWLIPLRD